MNTKEKIKFMFCVHPAIKSSWSKTRTLQERVRLTHHLRIAHTALKGMTFGRELSFLKIYVGCCVKNLLTHWRKDGVKELQY